MFGGEAQSPCPPRGIGIEQQDGKTFEAPRREKRTGASRRAPGQDTRGAVEAAKLLVREEPGAASESLAVRAYAERIKALITEGLGREAAAIAGIVRERFPAHVASWTSLLEDARLAAGDFDWILSELRAASAERRADLEERLLPWISDPSVIARASAEADRRAMSRIARAAEEARKRLSFEPHTFVREENIVEIDGVPQHVEMEIDRDELEETILPLVKQTLESVHRALADAGKRPGDLDGILLVGGATRTPLVSSLLEEATGFTPRQDLHPDLCVALGAGVQAARIEGHDIERVLVDVSPGASACPRNRRSERVRSGHRTRARAGAFCRRGRCGRRLR